MALQTRYASTVPLELQSRYRSFERLSGWLVFFVWSFAMPIASTRKTVTSVLVFGLLWTSLLGVSVRPLAATENELTLNTERVIIFKDGYFLIIKRGLATANDRGEVFTDDVPDSAVLGTFWAVPDEGRLVNMHAGWKTTEANQENELQCRDTLEILLANQGKQARVELHDKTVYSGTIQEILGEKTSVPIAANFWELQKPGASSPLSSARRPRSTPIDAAASSMTLSTFQGSSFLLRTEEGDVLLSVQNIRSISIKEMTTKLKRTTQISEKAKRLTFTTASPGKKVALTLFYFRPGIRWIPTYRVSLSEKEGKKLATVALQAELLNEAEDLHNVPIDLVVGVPNFRFRDTISPMVLESTLRNTLLEAAPHLMGQQMANNFSNSAYSQRSSEFRANAAAASGVGDGALIQLPNELTATGAQDLFVYKLPKTSILKGERVAVTIFQNDSTYRDIYTWDVRINRSDIEAAPSGAGVNSPLSLAKNEVWHQIEVLNNTNMPWTTGAVLLMQGNQPLAQELLTYTSPKNDCRIPMTVAVELKGSFEEKETGRQLNALGWDGYPYAKIEKEAKVHLCNNKREPVDVEMTLRLGGRVNEAEKDGKIELGAFRAEDWTNYHGSPAVNNSSTVKWTTKLGPGEVLEPKVLYHFFTRH